MSYLTKDILVFGEDKPGEEVLNDTEVQDLVTNGHADPWSWLGGRRHGQHREKPRLAWLIYLGRPTIYEPTGPPQIALGEGLRNWILGTEPQLPVSPNGLQCLQ